MEVPRQPASALQADKFMVFQVQTGMICGLEEDVVLSIYSPCPLLSFPKHTWAWLSNAIVPGLVTWDTQGYLHIFSKNK